MEIAAKNKGYLVDSLDDIERIGKIAKYGKRMSNGLFAFTVLLGIDDVYNSYKNGDDAFREAFGVAMQIGVMQVVGNLLLVFTPAGWTVLIVTAVVEGLLFVWGGEEIKEIGKEFAGDIEEAYQWLKNTLAHWL